MRIDGFLCVYNDFEYLEKVLQTVKTSDYFHKFWIIEGSWQSAQKSSGAVPRSEQIVYDIINKFVDNKKIFLVQANEPLEKDQRNVGMQLAREDKADWVHFLDADEIYLPSAFKKIKNTLSITPNDICGYKLNSYNFINSYKKWYNGQYKRIFRVTAQSKFVMDNDVVWEDNKNTMLQIPLNSFYHYNYVKLNTKAFWTKLKYQNFQDPTFWSRYVDNGEYKEEQGKYSIPKDCKIFDFIGKHPKIMQDHPYFIKNIYNDNNIEFLNE
jgi:hypothetical protein